MSWQIHSLAQAAPVPWKNGGGLTRELLAWPSAQDWVWRISVADIAHSGPFSQFEGVQRWFAVLSGAGVQLDVGPPPTAASHRLAPHAPPLCFEGQAPVQCTLIDGAAQAFNLMLSGDSVRGHMLRVNGQHALKLDDTKTIAVYSIDTGASVCFDDERLVLPQGTLAWRHCPAGRRLHMHASQALWMELTH
jgi:environmental stress-induced protein Ves